MAAAARAPPAATPRVGLLYDERMCAHATPDGEDHPEKPERLRSIWRKLNAEGVASRYGSLRFSLAAARRFPPRHSPTEWEQGGFVRNCGACPCARLCRIAWDLILGACAPLALVVSSWGSDWPTTSMRTDYYCSLESVGIHSLLTYGLPVHLGLEGGNVQNAKTAGILG